MLRPHGIVVSIIEPGGTRSEWGGTASEGLLARSGTGPYAAQAKVMAAAPATTDKAGLSTPPEAVADAIVHAAAAARPRTRYPVGGSAGRCCCCAACCRTGCSTA